MVFLTGIRRRQNLSSELERLLQYQDDSNVYVKQSLVMSLLGLSDPDKNILTRSIKEIFPNVTKKTLLVKHENMYPFLITHVQYII